MCFVGKISLPQFLQQQLQPVEGNVVEVRHDLEQFMLYKELEPVVENLERLAEPFRYEPSDGVVVAKHIGAHYYTIGQRKGLHIGGRPHPSFVVGIDTDTNTVYSGQTDSHPGLNRWALELQVDTINWINSEALELFKGQIECLVRIRYRQPLQKALLVEKNGRWFILFESTQKGITPGQFAAWYLGNELIGSAVILS